MDDPRRGRRLRLHGRPGARPCRGRLDPGPALRRGSRPGLRPSSGVLTQARFPDGRAGRDLGAGRQRGQRLLRPAAGQADRHRRRPPGRRARPAGGPGRHPAGRRRDQPRLAARGRRQRGLRLRPGLHPGAVQRSSTTRRRSRVLSGGPATTVQDHPGRLGYWDVGVAAVGTDGRPRLPPGQPPAGQRPGRRRSGVRRRRAQPDVQRRLRRLPDRAPTSPPASTRRRSPPTSRSSPRPARP